jgi:hypothetical protein
MCCCNPCPCLSSSFRAPSSELGMFDVPCPNCRYRGTSDGESVALPSTWFPLICVEMLTASAVLFVNDKSVLVLFAQNRTRSFMPVSEEWLYVFVRVRFVGVFGSRPASILTLKVVMEKEISLSWCFVPLRMRSVFSRMILSCGSEHLECIESRMVSTGLVHVIV